MTTLKSLVILVIIAYGGVLALMYLFQRSLMYFPDRARTPPAAAGLPQAEEVILTSADGERLIAWHAPPRPAKALVIYFHGNGGALNLRAGRFSWLIADGFGLLALSYRGYGGSTGKPTEGGLLLDAAAAYDFAAARYPNGRIVLWGESLGTGVAVALAAVRRTAGLILDAPFTSAADIGASAYPFIPVCWFIKDAFRSDERIGQVRAPLLVLHGEQDRIVPVSFGERLFSLANEPKRMVRFPRAGHVDLDDHGAPEAVRSFLNGLTGATR
ncbi:MAG TPA: alpha/beta hydrolase [Pseudolabrys sp.]|nr:alpha/beta hydrolase [Pseudolabrys sp.]